jgi:hypothetical protein
MPALVNQATNTTFSPVNNSLNTTEPRVQSLLFNTITVLFAAASVVIGFLQLLHQRRVYRTHLLQDGMFEIRCFIKIMILTLLLRYPPSPKAEYWSD